jgi:N-acetyl-gamma-glutamyl-phosphate reductase
VFKIGIVGGTGYTGAELIRLLTAHPQAELAVITSRGDAGTAVAELFPNLRGYVDMVFSEPDVTTLSACDLVFFATPNGIAMTMVPELLANGTRIVDLAADFRLKDVQVWQQWYGMAHACPELLERAVYGLPEVNRELIKEATLVANPGCYPTSVQLGFLPLLKNNLVDTRRLIADAKSGVSGAGRGAQVGTLLCEATESFKAYGASGHRHLPEIRQGLGQLAGQDVQVTFVPHLVPMIRGIEATLYAELQTDITGLQALYEQTFQDEVFIDVMPSGSLPETRTVRGTNLCRIALHQQPGSLHVVIIVVIDNLVKGAAGQAVQNMNLMLGLQEDLGLRQLAMLPV